MPKIAREEELLRRTASAFATTHELRRVLGGDGFEELPAEGPLATLPEFLKALELDLTGRMGCLEEAEWNVGRRAKAIAYIAAESVVQLPDEDSGSLVVVGVCPMGCGASLMVGAAGHITCTYAQCPNPTAASEMLSAEASNQRTEEAVTSTKERFEIESKLDAMTKLVVVLLAELRGAWWLKAAQAYQGLHRMVNQGEESPQITEADAL